MFKVHTFFYNASSLFTVIIIQERVDFWNKHNTMVENINWVHPKIGVLSFSCFFSFSVCVSLFLNSNYSSCHLFDMCYFSKATAKAVLFLLNHKLHISFCMELCICSFFSASKRVKQLHRFPSECFRKTLLQKEIEP